MKPFHLDPERRHKRLITQKEVAQILGKSTKWCERKRWEGGGPPFRKIGRHVRYELEDILEYIESHPKVSNTSNKSEQTNPNNGPSILTRQKG